MQASVIIPVWNGSQVVGSCLDALLARAGAGLGEIICVDNDSSDNSAELIAGRYPTVCLLRQPVNLGFAGGVNAGLEIAGGDVLVLLNQDCLVRPGWLAALLAAFSTHPQFGILGSTIFHANGAVDHRGAILTRPLAYGQHLTEPGNAHPRAVDYVTGAALAMRRETWDLAGRLDDGFYPAYYEEVDYCYRARSKGAGIAWAPQAEVDHLRTSREAERDPLKHWANQHRSRYRFVCKHFTTAELSAFFTAEIAAIAGDTQLYQLLGQALAARDTLRGTADILHRRQMDLGEETTPELRCQLQTGFGQVLHAALAGVERPGPAQSQLPVANERLKWEAADRDMRASLSNLLRSGSKGPWQALSRAMGGKLPASQPDQATAEQMEQLRDKLAEVYSLLADQRKQMDRRLTILELLATYDYR